MSLVYAVGMTILNLNGLTGDPTHDLIWLGGVKQAVTAELDDAYAEVYAGLRREGRLEWAIKNGPHGKKRILALTRRWNRERGQMIRWNDGVDYSSSAYEPPE